MRLDVVVKGQDTLPKMQEAAKKHAGLEVHFYQAPDGIAYVLPFPFVTVADDNNDITRAYGAEAEKLFYSIIAGSE